MAEVLSTLAAWRVGGQIDESALTGINQFADITVTATLVGAAGQNVVDPTNDAHDLRGPYTTVVGGSAGTATTHPSTDGNATLAGRLWWTEPLKATSAADPADALQPSGLAWSIAVVAVTRRGDSHTLATFTVGIEGDRDYTALGETIQVPPGTGGAEESAINVTYLEEPPATVVDNTFVGRVSAIIAADPLLQGQDGADGADGAGFPTGGTSGQALVKLSAADYDTEWADVGGGSTGWTGAPVNAVDDFGLSTANTGAQNVAALQAMFDYLAANPGTAVIPSSGTSTYAVTGTVTVPDGPSVDYGFEIDARGARFVHTGGGSFIATRTFASLTDAANTTGRRTRRRWRGGHFVGDFTAGSICFNLRSWNFCTLDNVTVQYFARGVQFEFCLNSVVQRSTFINTEHDIRLSSMAGSGISGSSASNSSSNMSRIEGCRFLGSCTASRVLVRDSGGVMVRDCTSEGPPVPIHIDIESSNTSAMNVTVENLWIESGATVAYVRVSTFHQVKIGFAHLVPSGACPAIKSLAAGAVIVTDMPNLGTAPLFQAANTNEEWRFGNMANGRFNAREPTFWVGGLVGEVSYLGGNEAGDGTMQIGEYERVVSGSRSSGFALADLLNQLWYMGIITNSTTA